MLSSSIVSLFLVTAVLANTNNPIDGVENRKELHFLAPHPLAGQSISAKVVVDHDVNILHSEMLGHYGKPPSDCLPDEMAFQISGVPGMVCAPTCDKVGRCPTDMPDGVSARPQCALEDRSSGLKYCVLICQESMEMSVMDRPQDVSSFLRGLIHQAEDDDDNTLENGMCGDATCQEVQPGLGICTYDI